jgi:hypothetical protein
LKHRGAAVVSFTLPGAVLIHEGQIEGFKVRLPVFLARRPDEEVDPELRDFYMKLLDALGRGGVRKGQWRLSEISGWPDNGSFLNLVAWSWEKERNAHLVVVNLSDIRSQGRIRLPWRRLEEGSWQFDELLSGTRYRHNGIELEREGLFVNLEPWGVHLFEATAGAF